MLLPLISPVHSDMPLTGDHVVYMRLNKQLTAALIKIDATLGLNYLEYREKLI
jgi:hypothetical protein